MAFARRVCRPSTERLDVYEGVGAINFMGGTLLLAVGVALALGSAHALATEPQHRLSSALVLLTVALPFTMTGAYFALGRAWTVVDASRRSVTRSIGLLVPLRSRTYSLGQFEHVRVDRKQVDPGEPPSYTISLARRRGDRALRLCVVVRPDSPIFPERWMDPAALAAEIARLTGLPIREEASA